MSTRHIRGQFRLNSTTVKTTSGNVTVVDESVVVVKKSTGQATTVTLPAGPTDGTSRIIYVKDGKGDANVNPITVIPASGTIDGRKDHKISSPFAAALYQFNTTVNEWQVLDQDRKMDTGRLVHHEDFLLDAGDTLPKPWGKQDTSSSGSPTTDYVADALNGEYSIIHDSQSEQQNLTLYWADQLCIDPTKRPLIEWKLKINFAGATFSADQRIVFGLASARNATLDSVTTNVWFRIEGANLNILAEADDGTTDTDDTDTTIDIVDNTYTTFRIDLSDTSAIKFYVDGVLCATLAAAALANTMKLQPYLEIQRDAGSEQEQVFIDYCHVEWDR